MNNPTTEQSLPSGTIITLKDITDLINVRHDKAIAKILKLSKEPSFGAVSKMDIVTKQEDGRVNNYISTLALTKKQAIASGARLNNELLMKVIDRLEELEKPLKTIPQTYVEALEALVVSEKLKQKAIDTKAEIGSRREATSMNTASQAVKKANKLELELDKAKDYCSIKRMTMLTHGQGFDWRVLKSTSTEMGISPVDVFDANYGTVKAYHADVWMEAYGLTF